MKNEQLQKLYNFNVKKFPPLFDFSCHSKTCIISFDIRKLQETFFDVLAFLYSKWFTYGNFLIFPNFALPFSILTDIASLSDDVSLFSGRNTTSTCMQHEQILHAERSTEEWHLSTSSLGSSPNRQHIMGWILKLLALWNHKD